MRVPTFFLACKSRTIAVVRKFLKSPKISVSYFLFEMRFGVSIPLNLRHQNKHSLLLTENQQLRMLVPRTMNPVAAYLE